MNTILRYICIFLVLFYLYAFHATAQPALPGTKVYNQALRSGDSLLAVYALNYLIAEDPGSSYRDTLAFLYDHLHKPAQAAYWAEDLLKGHPQNAARLKALRADCLRRMGKTAALVDALADLAKDDPANARCLYQLADAQFDAKRRVDALATLSQIGKLAADTIRCIPYTASNSNMISYTSIAATAANMQGMIYYEMKQYDMAKTSFTKALSLDRSYQLPLLNLKSMEREKEDAVVKETKLKKNK